MFLPTTLTESWISATVATFDGRRLEVGDRQEPGLRLRIGEASANWSVMTRGPGGEKARLPLGSWPGVSLERARSLAKAFKRTFADTAAEELDELAVVTLLERYKTRRLSQLRKGDVM